MVLRFGERANFIYQVSAKKFLVIHLSIRQLASDLFASKRQWYPSALGYVASSSLKRNRNLRKRSLITPSSRSPTRLSGLKSRLECKTCSSTRRWILRGILTKSCCLKPSSDCEHRNVKERSLDRKSVM